VTDAESRLLSAFLPPSCECGRRRKWEMREVINAIFYVLRGGIAWSLLPKDFPPWPTAYRWFARFRDDGTWETTAACSSAGPRFTPRTCGRLSKEMKRRANVVGISPDEGAIVRLIGAVLLEAHDE